jgi:ATP-dependent helicase/nuclease subunit B
MDGRRLNVYSIPSSVPFADALARGAIGRVGKSPLALADATIFLPTRRAARVFGDAFARLQGGAALLPKFLPLGDVDEEEFLFDAETNSLELPSAMSPVRRRLLLATLVQRWCKIKGRENTSFAHAVALADSLGALLDEAETQEADLGLLDGIVGGTLAEHWSEVRDCLGLLHDEWPNIAEAEGAITRAGRRNAALAALTRQFERPCDQFVIAAGSTGSIPATARLLAAIARLPNGAVVLPGLDQALDEVGWTQVCSDPTHPQYGLAQLIARIGIDRDEVRDWDTSQTTNAPRETLLREVLRPAPTTDGWRNVAEGDTATIAEGLKTFSLVEAADVAEEAMVIALRLRETLECAERSAALVTPDRVLARRVAAEMRRWDIEIDDSGGSPLPRTPPGTFLCLIAEAAEARFAPVALLAVLRHPFASIGGSREDSLRNTRTLDRALRGSRPDPGLVGIEERLAENQLLGPWFRRVADCLRPLEDLLGSKHAPLSRLVETHVAVAEHLAGDKAVLWNKEPGEAAKTMVEELLAAASDIPPIEPCSYPSLFRTFAEAVAVRPRGRGHHRLAILGPMEARLQSFDLTILGGLNEGNWPQPAAADPWLSRPMRDNIGLESPERTIGLAAHDFASLASRTHVMLTRANKADGAPTIASRWIQRLRQFSKGLNLEDKLAPEVDWCALARAITDSHAAARPAGRPAPAPPVRIRPRRLSVTEIETWRRDPYAIYARHILGLKALDPLDAVVGPLERGTLVHRALEKFVTRFPPPSEIPVDAAGQLIAIAEAMFEHERIPHSVTAVWRPRFAQAADWFVTTERERRARISASFLEARGELTIEGPAGTFLVYGRADRIDTLIGGGASIIDYKTGQPPSDKQVRELLSPQLPVEAAILVAGGFAAIGKTAPKEMTYVRFSGGAEAGSWRPVKADAVELAIKARALLSRYADKFNDPNSGYLSRAIAFRKDIAGAYDHLARHGEWTSEPREQVEE